MSFLSILNSVDSIEGNYFGIGYGNGEHIRNIKSFIESKSITYRNFHFFDNFKNYPVGSAIDFKLDNRQLKVSIIKKSYSALKNNLIDNLAILVINSSNPNVVTDSLNLQFPKLNNQGLLYIPNYLSDSSIKTVVDNYFNQHKLFLNVERNSDSFIKVGAFAIPSSFKISRSKNIKDIKAVKQVKPSLVSIKDRYEKEVIPKFIPTPTVGAFAIPSSLKISRSKNIKDIKAVKQEKPSLVNFKDTYEKEVIPKFIPTPTVVEGLHKVDIKVSK